MDDEWLTEWGYSTYPEHEQFLILISTEQENGEGMDRNVVEAVDVE